MSKTTKIIAALGVVAGLGVAALPAFSYAESTTGEVEVQVEVLPAIAMTISGNNDTPTHDSLNYVTVTPNPDQTQDPQNPSALGWYERSGSAGSYVYTASSDTSVDSEKTYYEKVPAAYGGVDSFSPAGIASTSTVTNTIDTHPIPQASKVAASSTYISLLPNAVETGDGTNKFSSTITVYTNANNGYNLTLKDADTNTALTQIVDSGTPDSIPATSATTLTAGTAAWGYRVYSVNGTESTPGTETEDTEWLAVPASNASSAAPISSLNTKTTGGDRTIVDYGVATKADQSTGVYADVIVYTATTAN